MKKGLLFLASLLTLTGCINKDEVYSLHSTLYPVAIWVDAKRYQDDELIISVTARHAPQYRTIYEALDSFTIARSIAIVDENYNQTWISTLVKIGTIKDFLSDKYDFYSKDSDVITFTDTFTTEYGEYVVAYDIINAEHDPKWNGGAYYPAIAFNHSPKGYTIHLPEERVSNK